VLAGGRSEPKLVRGRKRLAGAYAAFQMLATASDAEGFWIVLTLVVLFGALCAYHLKKGLEIAFFGLSLAVVAVVIIIKAGP
jgi:hypothetical protein